MGQDTRAADERRGLQPGLRTSGRIARRAARSEGATRLGARRRERLLILDQAGLERWGRRLGGRIARPAFIALSGPLGAGKSVLARAIAHGAGVTANMPSPTYNLVLRYDCPDGGSVLHMDLFRLEEPGDVWELGWADLGAPGEIALVEWPERAASLLPRDRWELRLEPVPDPLRRRLAIRPVGQPPELPQ